MTRPLPNFTSTPSLILIRELTRELMAEQSQCAKDGVLPTESVPFFTILQAVSVGFIFSKRFHQAVQRSTKQAVILYGITSEEAIEEFRRFISLKSYMKDEKADILGPTPISKVLFPMNKRRKTH
ncbi:MAG: hypothetical protein EOP45_05475 [Sphingobacteriaceae bacterium]|nr:MAG: hypothetical protein EOP45_05475 [Sphingobacteriaceae bacterium]